jgi:hypothetical protein
MDRNPEARYTLVMRISREFVVTLFLAATVIFFGGAKNAVAQVPEHEAIRRLVVFPFLADKTLSKVAEDSWWNLREQLSDNKRFLIASKNFMEVKDVYQARGYLTPADAIILGRLLDAHALITVVIEFASVSMQTYETKSGSIIWQRKIDFHPSIPISKQIPEAIRKLALDFISSLPYQGYLIVDPLIGRAMFQEGGRNFVRADIGSSAQIKVGDPAQLISITARNLLPLYEGGLDLNVLGEGVVTKVDRNVITIEVSRQKENVKFTEGTLVRMPQELRRLQDSYSLNPDLTERAGLQTLNTTATELTREEKETKPLVTSLSFIGNLALVLLLAL